ncbi:phenolic glucoside malonyltransferase 1-like [Musa acuminata AAA Group]|uniref:phenolic glucoside malonyltransferase 1-like n=1 Tax=Musa acuminata AAA Group TaxID=214697 RepID=UPI0031E470BC
MASLPAFRVLVITISIAESTLPLTFFDLAWICHPLDKYEIHYADGGDSVPFTVAEYEADFEDISGTHARDINVLRPLVPQLPKSDDGRVPPLALQVTVFPNQGAAIGVAVHHAACDGLSSTRFMSSWASTRARSKGLAGALASPPVFDRSMIARSLRDRHSYHVDINYGFREKIERFLTNMCVWQ